ncbi:hypothetical protein [Absidia glauca]|uniref:Uncharacterized protein n=1 Tax=Absidia glauca TaxID=4829 RepID=A0A163KUY3_ABSGL|nr:hypothetical protein [Absidia glauca]
MKIKPPRQAQEWSSSSRRESIIKTLSSPKDPTKRHISSAAHQLVWRVTSVANVDQMPRQGPMEQHNDKRRISHQPRKRISAIDDWLSHIGSILLSCTCRP